MHAEANGADPLLGSLERARTREQAADALRSVRDRFEGAPHKLRSALERVTEDRAAARRLSWPAVETVRAALDDVDRGIDRALVAALEPRPAMALARELAACADDAHRTQRSLAIVWQHVAPPAARAAALVIDLLREEVPSAARVAVYHHLVGRGVDVRSALADDTQLDSASRTAVLEAWSTRNALVRGLRPLVWSPDPLRTLARALSDWTVHATHPRQLFFSFRVAAGLADARAYGEALDAIARWPLPPEVRAHLADEHRDVTRGLPARSLGTGRFACVRCGDAVLAAIAQHPVDPSDPLRGMETEFRCRRCGLDYLARWDADSLDRSAEAVPSAVT